MLNISNGLQLPIDAVTQKNAIVGMSGSGKTNTGVVLAEEILRAGQQIVILDLPGVWWGLRSSKDGQHAGMPIYVLGGDHGDVPLNVGNGALVAELVVSSGASVLLDLGDWHASEKRKFAADFLNQLFVLKNKKKSPMHLIVDEADEIAPQQLQEKGTEALSLSALSRVQKQGRVRGIGLTVITQRPQDLAKKVLNLSEVLITLRLGGSAEIAAVDGWYAERTDKEFRAEIRSSLPSLGLGMAWIGSAFWLKRYERVQIRERETFDSSRTPTVGETIIEPRQIASVDIERLRSEFTAAAEEQAANSPVALKAQIEDLKRQIAAKPAAERVEVPVLSESQEGRLREIAETISQAGGDLHAFGKDLMNAAGELTTALDSLAGKRQVVPAPTPRPAAPVERPAATLRQAASSEGVTVPQQRILDALAAFEVLGLERMDRSNVAVFADQSPRSSGFTNNLGRLRTLGLIDYPEGGMVCLTDSGRNTATTSLLITSSAELHAAWFAKLSNPQVRILQALIAAYPNSMTRTDLAAQSGQSATSSGYTNNLGSLRTLKLIDYPQRGEVAATALLFPEGLR